jgi:hypothetical protein
MNQSLNTTQPKTCPAIAVVVFGLGDGDKPQAARFPEKLSNLAIKAAEQLKLNVLKVTTDEVAKIAAQLPVGRINANGRACAGTRMAATLQSKNLGRSSKTSSCYNRTGD